MKLYLIVEVGWDVWYNILWTEHAAKPQPSEQGV